MAWIKKNSNSGPCYYIDRYVRTVHVIKDLQETADLINTAQVSTALGELTPRYGFEENPNFYCERSAISLNAELGLPSGAYTLKAEETYSDSILYPIKSSHDAKLFELDVVGKVIADFRSFMKQEQVYRDLQLLYKRGVLLYGPPGTGKTTAIQMIVDKCRPKNSVVIYITSSIPRDLIEELREDKRFKIIVFEELTQTLSSTNINRFLTFLDGESSLDNLYVIGTTNYPESLPGNIVDRPGRFDKLFKIDHTSDSDRKTYIKYFLKRVPKADEIASLKSFSMASLKEILLITLKEDISITQAVAQVKAHQDTVKSNFKEASQSIGFFTDDDD